MSLEEYVRNYADSKSMNKDYASKVYRCWQKAYVDSGELYEEACVLAHENTIQHLNKLYARDGKVYQLDLFKEKGQ